VTCEAEANADYDYTERYYTKCVFKFEFRNVKFYKNLTASGSQNLRKTNIYYIITRELASTPPSEDQYRFYLHSISKNVKTRSRIDGKQKCTGDFYQNTADIRYRGSFWDGCSSKRHMASYWSSQSPYELTCTEDSGYQIISNDTIQDVFNLAISGDISGTLSAISNILDDIF